MRANTAPLPMFIEDCPLKRFEESVLNRCGLLGMLKANERKKAACRLSQELR